MSDFLGVVTISEAAMLFFRSKRTIMYHINRGNLRYRKLEGERRGLYIIELQSLIQLYGIPKTSI